MLDPLTALSVATTVVQFVDFGSKLVNKAHRLYKSGSGILEEHVEINDITADLLQLSERVNQAVRADSDGWSEGETSLQDMARMCEEVSREILAILAKMSEKTSRFASWDAFQKAFRSLRKESEIQRLQVRLDRMRSQLCLHLLETLQNQHSSVATSLQQLQLEARASRIQAGEDIRKAKEELLSAVQQARDATVVPGRARELLEAVNVMKLETATEIQRNVKQIRESLVLTAINELTRHITAKKSSIEQGLFNTKEEALLILWQTRDLHGMHSTTNSLVSDDPGTTEERLKRLDERISRIERSQTGKDLLQAIDAIVKNVLPSTGDRLRQVKSSTNLEHFCEMETDLEDLSNALRRLKTAKTSSDQMYELTAEYRDAQSAVISLYKPLLQNANGRLASSLERIRNIDNAAAQISNLTKWTDIIKLDTVEEIRAMEKDNLAASLADSTAVYRAPYAVIARSFDTLSGKISSMTRVVSSAATSQAILESLRFKEMPMRYIQIPEAYAKTNSWVFEADKGPFNSWLQASTGVFWINGKAGSGKSTLVKFIADNTETRRLLRVWAGVAESASDRVVSRQLVVASWYFWKSGYPMQRSLRGLLQCLLYHIFHQCSSMIPIACRRRWEMDGEFHRNPDPWTHGELIGALDSLLQLDEWPSRFCFFIDGLDEYDGTADEQYAMVQLLGRLGANPFVKVCVSSRPWNVFRSAYDGDETQKIVLQDHNRADLDTYIAGKLESDGRFRRLAALDDRAPSFALEIRQRANGVFLWVFLVIKSLLDGLTEDDDIPMLQARLRALPPTLEEYFALMLRSIDPVYKRYTARALLLACNAAQALPALSYYCLESEINDPSYALKAPIQAISINETQEQTRKVINWINKWCRDLLEINWRHRSWGPLESTQECYIDFLHRTVRDFLIAGDMQCMLEKNAGLDFNTRLSLCRSYLMHAKTLSRHSLDIAATNNFNILAGYLMFHAKECEIHDRMTPYDLLEELDKVGSVNGGVFRGSHWTCACPRFDDLNPGLRESNFLSYAIEFDLLLYVRKALERVPDDIVKTEGAPLLEYALRPTIEHEVFLGPREPLDDMIVLLLERGASIDATHISPLIEPENAAKIGRAVSRAIPVKRRDHKFDTTASLIGKDRHGTNEELVRHHLAVESGSRLLGTSSLPQSYMSKIAYGRDMTYQPQYMGDFQQLPYRYRNGRDHSLSTERDLYMDLREHQLNMDN